MHVSVCIYLCILYCTQESSIKDGIEQSKMVQNGETVLQ